MICRYKYNKTTSGRDSKIINIFQEIYNNQTIGYLSASASIGHTLRETFFNYFRLQIALY